MRVAVRKLEGVESVEVSLQRGQASIRLRPGNGVTLQQLRQLVKDNGFNAREATVTVRGQVVQEGNTLALSVAGTGAVLTILPDEARPAAYRNLRERLTGSSLPSVTLEGLVPEPPSKDSRDRLRVTAVEGNVP